MIMAGKPERSFPKDTTAGSAVPWTLGFLRMGLRDNITVMPRDAESVFDG
jgi:hypothetical protein